MLMAAVNILVLFFLLAALRHVSSQCVPNCGCTGTGCCLVVQENQISGTEVGRVPRNLTEYSLVETFSGTFSIDQTGVISTGRMLDRETETFPMFVGNGYCVEVGINGAGGALEELVNIKVSDVNDNPPVFEEPMYTFDVFETTTEEPIYACSLMVRKATDADDQATVIYEVEGNENFTIPDPSEPCVTNIPSFDMDRDLPPTNYSFTLVARNPVPSTLRSKTVVTYVLLDRNDNAPMFENETYTIWINESLEPVSEIFQFRARDMDLGMNGEDGLIYSITRGGDTVFEINGTSGVLRLIGQVDADAGVKSYNLELMARDGGENALAGSANVIVNIMDVNELGEFVVNSIVTTVTENQPFIAFALITIHDGDSFPNDDNSLEVIGSEGVFRVDRTMGQPSYRLLQIGSVDFEQNRTFQIVLRSTERGNPPLTQTYLYNITVIDVNDNPPGLRPPQFLQIMEEELGDLLIGNLSQYAFDLDSGANGMVESYVLVSVANSTADLTSTFAGTLDRDTGVLTTGGVKIDREVFGNSLNYTVNITDRGDPKLSQLVSFAVTILDKNDNRPVFPMLSYTFTLNEGKEIDADVGTVQATDSDYQSNGVIVYSIVEPNDPKFSIQERTGEIKSRAEFDREIVASYNITVSAQDEGRPRMSAEPSILVTIIIADINDKDPVFTVEQYSFNISTNLRPGEEVGKVAALDEDTMEFSTTVYKLESDSSFFSVGSSTGVVILLAPVTSVRTFALNISAFNPDREATKNTVTVTVTVSEPMLELTLIAGVAGGALILVILIVVVFVIILCMYCRSRRFNQYNMKEISNKLNNAQQHPILKMPVAGNNQQGRSRVTFKESVEETHYHEQSVVIDTDNTVRKESITKFDTSPQGRLQYSSTIDEEEISPDHDSPQDPAAAGTSLELDVSPSHLMNGSIPSHHHHGYGSRGPHLPIVHVVNGPTALPRGAGREDVDFSQNTSSDGHTYMDDEESMFSDDASIVNTALSRYAANKGHDLDARYRTPPSHSHLELHHHLPPISHGQPTSSSLAQLHAHNLAQLAEANRQQHFGNANTIAANGTSDHGHSLTLTPQHNHLQHNSMSTQSTHSPPSPSPAPHHHAHSHMATSASMSSNHSHTEGRNYPGTLVMPDAFPRDTTDIHRFPIGSYADYGEASTYASADLDEALGFNLEAEPGIISLTATDYEDTEL